MLAEMIYWPARMISDFPDMPYRDGGNTFWQPGDGAR